MQADFALRYPFLTHISGPAWKTAWKSDPAFGVISAE
jgi:hypothetical protein